MRRGVVFILLAAFAAPACGSAKNDARELRRFLRNTVDGPRVFTYQELSDKRSFTIKGEVEDDLRFRMVLASDAGDLIEEVVSDDSLAIRLLQPQLAAAIPTPLGSPKVDEALRAGRWAMSPSGAPPLQRQQQQEDLGEIQDPLTAALEDLRYITLSLSQASGVREFNLEDLDYRPKEDPWMYPNEDAGETRYDLLRPAIPKREEQLGGPSGQSDVTTATFRKLSTFVKNGRVYRVCEVVDVSGHEEYVRAKQENRNPFLIKLVKRVLEGKTARPIREREVVREITFPESVTVSVPADAVQGSLEAFQLAFQQSVESGALAPAPDAKGRSSDCVRKDEEK